MAARILWSALVVLAMTFAQAGALSTDVKGHAVLARLNPVGHSGVSGLTLLRQPEGGETMIWVGARGLRPGNRYVSLYYDNHACALEPYSAEDVIGGPYRANRGGIGLTRGTADDDLDEINSVSVRQASDFKLLACANIHP